MIEPKEKDFSHFVPGTFYLNQTTISLRQLELHRNVTNPDITVHCKWAMD